MIALASDHGFQLKAAVMEYLKKRGIDNKDYGCYDENRCGSADFAVFPCRVVRQGEAEKTILICISIIATSIPASGPPYLGIPPVRSIPDSITTPTSCASGRVFPVPASLPISWRFS